MINYNELSVKLNETFSFDSLVDDSKSNFSVSGLMTVIQPWFIENFNEIIKGSSDELKDVLVALGPYFFVKELRDFLTKYLHEDIESDSELSLFYDTPFTHVIEEEKIRMTIDNFIHYSVVFEPNIDYLRMTLVEMTLMKKVFPMFG